MDQRGEPGTVTVTGKQLVAALIAGAALLSAVILLITTANDIIEERIEESPTISAIQAEIDSLDRALQNRKWHDTIHDKQAPPKGHGQ